VTTLTAPIREWLAHNVPADAAQGSVTVLAAEASFRQFYRLQSGEDSWILMDSPPDKERNDAFCELAGIFAAAGLPVPRVIAAQAAAGWYLLSDLGRRDFEAAYADGDQDAALDAAIDALTILQRVDHPAIAPYTRERFADELNIFTEWFLNGLLDQRLPAAIGSRFEQLIARTQQQPQCCVHRDYHCRNLLFSARGELGIVDFQDALIGPVGYDLASLLHDCYHEFPEATIAAGCESYLRHPDNVLPAGYDAQRFRKDVDFCAIQRQLKAIGIFARLAQRDSKTSHLRYISPLLVRLARLCGRYPQLSELSGFLLDLTKRTPTWQS
jgi:aminoglycoside/choline kinase family phosphotransferase